MFLLNEILWCLPFLAYAAFRVWRLIPRRGCKVLFLLVLIPVLAGFPLAERISHGSSAAWTRPVMMAGYYTLPLLLYFMLFVVAADLVLGLLRLVRVIPGRRLQEPRLRVVRLSLYLLVPVLVVIGGIWNYNHLRVKTSVVEVPARRSPLARLRIVFASDLHLGARTAVHFMDKFVDKVNAQAPDVILIGGDVLEGDRSDEDIRGFESQFRRLRAKFGVYAVRGNHEGHRAGAEDFFKMAGIRLLVDEVVPVEGAFRLAGRNDGRSGRRETIAELLREVPRDLPLIVLDHRPTDLDNVSREGADILLCGHTHHGQLFPVNFITAHRYELDWGYERKGSTHIFVSSGVQLWGPPVRTTGDSEILVIDVVLI